MLRLVLVLLFVTAPIAGAADSSRQELNRQSRAGRNSTSLDCLPWQLRARVQQILVACRSARVLGTRAARPLRRGGLPSNHESCKAADVAGDPGCIYAQLRGFAGGWTTDYWNAPLTPHVHIVWNPGDYEHGRQFTHGRRRDGKPAWPRTLQAKIGF